MSHERCCYSWNSVEQVSQLLMSEDRVFWQVWLPKGVASQTHVNKGQSMPRKLRHIAGLRGTPGTHMKVLNLELDLGQPYHQ